MSSGTVLIGVDGGGTKTKVVVIHDDQVIGRANSLFRLMPQVKQRLDVPTGTVLGMKQHSII